ncbi:MAG: ABC transporter permease [Thermomicrobiales bacterium]|nr:ABC transporter permease [Thermomicrobiales bacterium]
MNELFGISMTSVMVTLLSLLALCLLTVAWVGWRRPVIFKMGMRNIPRRHAQTVLIVVGLMLITLIMSAALGTGDTIDYSMTSDVYDTYGNVDEHVVKSQTTDPDLGTNPSVMDASALDTVDTALAGHDDVDGIMPELRVIVPAINEASQLAEPMVTLVGVDPARLDGFGGIGNVEGGTVDLASMPAGSVALNEHMASEIDAKVGDVITVYVENQPHQLTVAAIAENSYLTGGGRNFDTGTESVGMVMPLAQAQELTGKTGLISSVLVSNVGGKRDGIERSDSVIETLRPALEGTGLGAIATKQEWVQLGEDFSQIFTGLFLVLGLFSIAAGILLIVLIFTMLAAERRSEMGMARAVGQHRRQLIHQFISEGAGYALIAGFLGAALGVLAALGIGAGLGYLFGDFVNITPHVTLRSLVVAYSLGVVITFLAVVGSSWKISRLNVVAAIRDLPDEVSSKRKKRSFIWAGLLLLVGGLLTMQGADSGSAFPFYAGMSMMPFGVAIILRFFRVPSRPIYSLIGLYLIVFWLLPEDQFTKIFGEYDGDFEMFFLSGIFMVIGATILIVQNSDVLLRGVTALGGVFRSKLPAIRMGVAYPGAARGRTGLTISMFSLIIFSLVTMATMNNNYVNLFLGDEANAGWHVNATAAASNPIADFQSTLQSAGVDTSEVEGVGELITPSEGQQYARVPGTTEWLSMNISGQDAGFLAESELLFGQRAVGYESDEAIMNALATQPNLAIVDVGMLDGTDDFGEGGDGFKLTDLTSDDKTFEPISIEVADPVTSEPRTLTVIGVLDSKISIMYGIFTSDTTLKALYPEATFDQSFFLKLSDPDDAKAMAKQVESSLLRNGVESVSIKEQIEDGQRQSSGFLYIIQGFMGLGLVFGIAAIGVIAFRSVVERRQQIGVLRAIGYQRGLVSLSFMIETAYIVGIGSLAGTTLGLLLSRNLFTSDEAASSADFLIPYNLIGVILVATIAVSLLMTWVPSRQAARISPADALRYE